MPRKFSQSKGHSSFCMVVTLYHVLGPPENNRSLIKRNLVRAAIFCLEPVARFLRVWLTRLKQTAPMDSALIWCSSLASSQAANQTLLHACIGICISIYLFIYFFACVRAFAWGELSQCKTTHLLGYPKVPLRHVQWRTAWREVSKELGAVAVMSGGFVSLQGCVPEGCVPEGCAVGRGGLPHGRSPICPTPPALCQPASTAAARINPQITATPLPSPPPPIHFFLF